MSWSISKTLYRNADHAARALSAKTDLPQPIKDYATTGLANIQDRAAPVLVEGNGHVCTGPGSYEVTTAQLSIVPLSFAADAA